jgi:hypothetical protein
VVFVLHCTASRPPPPPVLKLLLLLLLLLLQSSLYFSRYRLTSAALPCR